MTARDETEVFQTEAAPESPLAYSDEAETDDFAEDASADERAYAWGTVGIFAACMAVTVAAAVWIGAVWLMHRDEAPTPPRALQTPTAAVVPSGPDDQVVPSTPVPPAPPPPAPPVSIDDQYLAALRADGITSGQGESGALGIGHSICRALDRGETRENVIHDVLRDNPSLLDDGARFLTDTAIRFYCPPPG